MTFATGPTGPESLGSSDPLALAPPPVTGTPGMYHLVCLAHKYNLKITSWKEVMQDGRANANSLTIEDSHHQETEQEGSTVPLCSQQDSDTQYSCLLLLQRQWPKSTKGEKTVKAF